MPSKAFIAVVATLSLLAHGGAHAADDCPNSVDDPRLDTLGAVGPLVRLQATAPSLAGSFKILILGDSVAAGTQGRPVGAPFHQILEDRLVTEVDPEIVVVNGACGGTSTHDWASHEPSCCPQDPTGFAVPNLLEARAEPHLPADVVVLIIGGNDASGFGEPHPRTPEEYADALTAVIGELLDTGVRRVVKAGSPKLHPLEEVCRRAKKNARLALLREVDHEVCDADPRVDCAPEFFHLLDASDYALCNPHPNVSGQQKMADALFETLVEVYLQLNPIPVELDLLPRSHLDRLRLNRRSVPLRRRVPLVISGVPDWDIAEELDLATLRFGVNGDENSVALRRRRGASDELLPLCFRRLHGRDRRRDLVCLIHTRRLGLAGLGRQPLVLTGRTHDGRYVRGETTVTVVGHGGDRGLWGLSWGRAG